jgi:hypothetical protein
MTKDLGELELAVSVKFPMIFLGESGVRKDVDEAASFAVVRNQEPHCA